MGLRHEQPVKNAQFEPTHTHTHTHTRACTPDSRVLPQTHACLFARAQRSQGDAGLAPAALPQGLHRDGVRRQQGPDLQFANQPRNRGGQLQPGLCGRPNLSAGADWQVPQRAVKETACRGAPKQPRTNRPCDFRPPAVAAAREARRGRRAVGRRAGRRLIRRYGRRSGRQATRRAEERVAPQALRELRGRLRSGFHAPGHRSGRGLAQGDRSVLGPVKKRVGAAL